MGRDFRPDFDLPQIKVGKNKKDSHPAVFFLGRLSYENVFIYHPLQFGSSADGFEIFPIDRTQYRREICTNFGRFVKTLLKNIKEK